MPLTRRQFLKRVGVATAGTVAVPRLFGNPFVRSAFADTIGDRYLVILFLDGGNDGLNTVIPLDDVAGLRADYESHRSGGSGGLRIDPGAAAVPSSPADDPGTGTALGFHPGLAPLVAAYDAGNVAVIQGTGYPDYSLSHESSRTIWETANPAGVSTIANTGWAGRHLALEYGPLDIYGVTINNSIAGELRATGTSVLAIRRLRRFGFPFDDFDEDDAAVIEEAYGDLHASAGLSPQALTSLIGNSGQATLQSTQSYPPLHRLYQTDRGDFDDRYDGLGTSTARDLREVAKIIYGVATGQPGVTARFFQVRNGGYDTHADQGGADPGAQHYSLHREVAAAVDVFMQDVNQMGIGPKVSVVIWSEFSRRIPQNSNGTDHGSQGPMFVIGESVNGGIYGNHPNINGLALDDRENTVYTQGANSFRSTDFRDVFGTMLKHWVNMDQASILTNVMPLDVGPAAEYWTVPNFDMGFL